MVKFCEYMAERGMIFEAGPHPEFPKLDDWDAYEIWRYPEYAEGATVSTEQARAFEAYQRELDAVLSWHGPEVPGIPAHKFGTNDGWIVTPAECEAAVRLAAEHEPPATDADYWAKWINYLDRASKEGGFEVR
jgi:hypothetical protein